MAVETLGKPEKFKKNFSKALAASLAIFELFSGNFSSAKAVNNSATDENVNARSKNSSTDSRKKNQKFDSFKDEWLTKKEYRLRCCYGLCVSFCVQNQKN